MAVTVKLSSKHQIVVPKEARESLAIGPGAELLVLCKTDRIVLIPKPKDYVADTRGLYHEIWTEGAEAYLTEEREHWDQ